MPQQRLYPGTWRNLIRIALVLAIGGLCFGRAPLFAQDEEDDETKRPGLVATYSHKTGDVAFVRLDGVPAVRLAAGESPDPRLASDEWKVTWRGVLEVLRPGKHRFWIERSGGIEIKLDGQAIFAAKAGAPEATETGEINLKFGYHPLEITFVPIEADARLKIEWSGENFSREPLSAFALGHMKDQAPPADPFIAGQLLVEEHSCVSCHTPTKDAKISSAVAKRPGPHLTNAGKRLKAGWIFHWLDNPHAMRPEAVMPKLFPAGRQGEIERYVIATYLASLGGPIPADKLQKPDAKGLASGAAAFQQLGCVVCHEPQHGQPARATLRGLGHKLSGDGLAAFIRDPGAIDPGGRMPKFNLQDKDAKPLAAYLLYREEGQAGAADLPAPPPPHEIREFALGKDATAEMVVKFSAKKPEEQIAIVARRIMAQRQCANCHELKHDGDFEPWKAKPAAAKFVDICNKPEGGCLTEGRASEGRVPVFGTSLKPAPVVAFLKAAATAPAPAAPGYVATLHLERFNCTGCHVKNGSGGLSTELITKLLEGQTETAAESIKPPVLTGVANKLLGVALSGVLTEGKRARPWMSMQMPQFKKDYMTVLPRGLAALDGDAISTEAPPAFVVDPKLAEAGRTLVGSKGFGCIKCHDMLGVASGGTRGPDLAKVGERIQPNWYHRWMTDPQRIEPGTRMPTVFLNNQSPYTDVLAGDPAQQREALWHYFLSAGRMPRPEGLETKGLAEVQFGGEKPVLMRTFLPNVTPRAIAIRFPNAVHLAYDAQSCRVAYAWSGEFLDMSPVWNNRGGQRAAIRGEIFWNGPGGFPWDVTTTPESIPDFTNRSKDTTLGAELPHDGQLHPSRLHFRGYSTKANTPRFQFQLELDQAAPAEFTEEVASIDAELAFGLLRAVTITAPAGRSLWLQVGASEGPATWQTADGKSGTIGNPGDAAIPADAILTYKQQGKTYIARLRQTSPAAEWVTAKQGDATMLMLRWPNVTSKIEAQLVVWRPKQDTAEAAGQVVAQELGK